MDRSAVRILLILVHGGIFIPMVDPATSWLESEIEVVGKLRTIGDEVLLLAILGEEGGSIERFNETNNRCISSNCKTPPKNMLVDRAGQFLDLGPDLLLGCVDRQHHFRQRFCQRLQMNQRVQVLHLYHSEHVDQVGRVLEEQLGRTFLFDVLLEQI